MIHRLYILAIGVVSLASTGCFSAVERGAIPVHQVPCEYLTERRTLQVPIDFRMLGRPADPEHIVDSGDTIGIYIADILGDPDTLPAVSYPNFRQRNGPIEPYVGHPIEVEADGEIDLPFIMPLDVRGMTIPEVRQAIIDEYVLNRELIAPDAENIQVSLIAPRARRIHVVRQDTRYNVPGLQRTDQFEISRRWAGSTLYLEADDCTVLSALLKTGGLPGIDARNEIWVMKGVKPGEVQAHFTPTDRTLAGDLPMMLAGNNSKIIRIPLQMIPGEAPQFDPEDVVLDDGDVVFLPRRDGDVFLTGGLLGGGRYPLNRDRDLDVLEAIAAATGNTHGPVGAPRSSTQFRSGPGNVISPTNLVIVRRISDLEQIKIAVDLRKAVNDPRERILVRPGDLLILRYRFSEIFANTIMNLTDFNLPLQTLW